VGVGTTVGVETATRLAPLGRILGTLLVKLVEISVTLDTSAVGARIETL